MPSRTGESVTWTDRHRDILQTLTHKVRLLTLEQITRTWWTDSASGQAIARRSLKKLINANYLHNSRLVIHPEIELSEPVVAWNLGDPEPHFGKVAYRLQSRWTLPLRSTSLFFATKSAANRFGGSGGELKNQHQVTHDLHVSTIYLSLLRTDPLRADSWLCEDLLERPKKRGEKVPDAALCDKNGRIRSVIEFGGSYSATRVQKFHTYCSANQLAYELW